MRYFVELSYQGTAYHGYQIQPNQISVQETLEHAFSTILNETIVVVGCGRTDTGVHAKQYFIHFEFNGVLPSDFQNRLNKFLPKDIAIHAIFPVEKDVHARFDAFRRKYEYWISLDKSPFDYPLSWYYFNGKNLNLSLMEEAANLIGTYQEFATFCKTNSDAKTMKCTIYEARWERQENRLVFHIAANRFLRGMVRLIVGACVQIGEGKASIADLKTALDEQKQMVKSLSVPAQGLYLMEIHYPEAVFEQR